MDNNPFMSIPASIDQAKNNAINNNATQCKLPTCDNDIVRRQTFMYTAAGNIVSGDERMFGQEHIVKSIKK